MAKYLVIVESPAKVKTVKKFLGSNYEVAASNGHVRDLPKSQLGIDIENDYEPKYITIRGKGELLASLRKEAKKADKVYLATDPDREGEAISWHLATALKLDEKKMRRITFNEITKSAVKESIKHARDIDMNLVDEQQTRRILDRMVGYRISPVLWKKIKRGLSAGRVQSVALRIIADREEEINAFIPEEYWSLDAVFKTPQGWLHLAHGVRGCAAGLRYVLYMYMTALDDPTRVIASPAGAFMVPEGEERVGDVSNVLFTNGWIADEDGKVFIYYASSDTRMHVATSTVERLVDYCMNTPRDGFCSSASVETLKKQIEKNLRLMRE